MTVKDLKNKIDNLIKLGEIADDSPVTAHVFVRDGVAIEWNDDIDIVCHSKYGDGLEINIDADGSGLIYFDPYDNINDRHDVWKQLKALKLINGEPYFKNVEVLK